jgi:hypothetical protein
MPGRSTEEIPVRHALGSGLVATAVRRAIAMVNQTSRKCGYAKAADAGLANFGIPGSTAVNRRSLCAYVWPLAARYPCRCGYIPEERCKIRIHRSEKCEAE